MKTAPKTTALQAPLLPSISVLQDRAKDERLKAEKAPRAEDFAREAGATVEYGKDGTWTATVRGAENIRRAVHMQNGSRKVEIERGQKLDASRPKETLVAPDGRTMAAPVHLAEQIAKMHGAKAKVNWGRPSKRYVARGGELVRVI